MNLRYGHAARFAVTLGGEVSQSVFHFALNIALVRTLSQQDYGIFAMVFLAGGIGLTYIRALAGIPVSTFVPPRLGRRSAHAIEVTFGSGAVLASLLLGVIVACGLMLAPDEVQPVAGGAFVAFWCLRSYLRSALYAKRLSLAATLGDLSFAVSGSLLAFWLARGDDQARIDGVFLALACGHVIGSIVSLVLAKQPVRVSFGRSFQRRYGALGTKFAWSLIGVTTTNLQGQGQTLLVALVAGPKAYAPIAAALVLFAPLRLSTAALINIVQPELAARLGRADMQGARRLATRTSVLILLACLAYGCFLAVAMPLISLHLFAGRLDHEPLGLITMLLWAVVTVSLTYATPRVLLETSQDFRFLAGAATVSAAIGLSAVTVILCMSTPAWSILGLLLAELVVFAAVCRLYLPAMREAGGGHSPTGPLRYVWDKS